MWVRNNKGNVFVGNLPPDFADERLAETFDPYGIVLSAIVARDPATGAKLRYGFVDIATERAASKAISALDGHEVDGCKLNVKARDKTKKKPAGAVPPRRQPLHAMAAQRLARDFPAPFEAARERTERPTPRRIPAEADAAPGDSHLTHAETPQPQPQPEKLSQSQRAMESAPEIEPPPRRDFEVVRRPIRRTTSSARTFQVERRSLPRRV